MSSEDNITSMQTRMIEPIYHNQSVRTEFHLGSAKYLPTMRLFNVGVAEDETLYVANAGAKALIKNIYMYDGNILIDSMVKNEIWATFHNVLRSNDNSRSMNDDLSGGKSSFDLSPANLIDIYKFPHYTPTAWIDLRDMLFSLRSAPFLTFKNLRIVIEWNTQPLVVTLDPRPAQLTINKPSIVVDQIETNLPFEGFQYYSIENDRITLPWVADPTVVKERIDGFNNKRVNRMLLATTDPNDARNDLNNRLYSRACVGEEIQLYLGNTKLYPSPVTEENKCAILNSVWGSTCQPAVSHWANNASAGLVSTATLLPLYDVSSYGAVNLRNNHVKDLQIEMKRSAPNRAMRLEVFAEVAKQVSFDENGDTVVRYL